MTIQATVIIPTFNHGSLLEYSIDSARKQTVKDIEIFVIGDGAPDITREIVAKIAAQDNRVRYFDFPKDSRHGEVYRHKIINEHAQGNIVCYLADDDLWLPNHLVVMEKLLRHADFAHTLVTYFKPDSNQWDIHWADFSAPYYRARVVHTSNVNEGVGLSHLGHTRAMYSRLPYGWRTTPKGIYTDVYMEKQILSQPWVIAASSLEATVMHFPSTIRVDWTLEAREAELAKFHALLNDENAIAQWRTKIQHISVRIAMCWREHIYALENRIAFWLRLRKRLVKVPYLLKALRWLANLASAPAKS